MPAYRVRTLVFGCRIPKTTLSKGDANITHRNLLGISKRGRRLALRGKNSKRGSRGGATKTREKLIGAAADLFNSVGYFGTDTNRIARAAGYAPATFYKYFADKREIFLASYAEWVLSEWTQIRLETASGKSRKGAAARITRLIVDHHRRWAVFRRSLRALALTDDVVRDFRLDQRKAQLAFMADLTKAAGGKVPRSGDRLFVLFAFERVCDAIADGESRALGVSDRVLMQRLQALIRRNPDS